MEKRLSLLSVGSSEFGNRVGLNTRFQPGVSGNPGGRPKGLRELETACRAYSSEAVQVLVDLMRNSKADRIRLVAASELLSRGFGKPRTPVETSTAFGDTFIAALQLADAPRHAAAIIGHRKVLTSEDGEIQEGL